jgi:hypothetical protein
LETDVQQTIYDATGGAAAVEAAVDLFYAKVWGDPSLSDYFASVDRGKLKGHEADLESAHRHSVPYDVHLRDCNSDGPIGTDSAGSRVWAILVWGEMPSAADDPAALNLGHAEAARGEAEFGAAGGRCTPRRC